MPEGAVWQRPQDVQVWRMKTYRRPSVAHRSSSLVARRRLGERAVGEDSGRSGRGARVSSNIESRSSSDIAVCLRTLKRVAVLARAANWFGAVRSGLLQRNKKEPGGVGSVADTVQAQESACGRYSETASPRCEFSVAWRASPPRSARRSSTVSPFFAAFAACSSAR